MCKDCASCRLDVRGERKCSRCAISVLRRMRYSAPTIDCWRASGIAQWHSASAMRQRPGLHNPAPQVEAVAESFHQRFLTLADEIERNYRVSGWKCGDVDIWPLARMDLY